MQKTLVFLFHLLQSARADGTWHLGDTDGSCTTACESMSKYCDDDEQAAQAAQDMSSSEAVNYFLCENDSSGNSPFCGTGIACTEGMDNWDPAAGADVCTYAGAQASMSSDCQSSVNGNQRICWCLSYSTGGDPITMSPVTPNQRIRFDLPAHKETLLLKVGRFGVYGRADLTARVGRVDSQWISEIIVRKDDSVVTHVRRLNVLHVPGVCESFAAADACPKGCARHGSSCKAKIGTPLESERPLKCTWQHSRSCSLDAQGVKKKLLGSGVRNQLECEEACQHIESEAPVDGCCWFNSEDKLCIYGEAAVLSEEQAGIQAAACVAKHEDTLVKRQLRTGEPHYSTKKNDRVQTMRASVVEASGKEVALEHLGSISLSDDVNVTVHHEHGWLGPLHKEAIRIDTPAISLKVIGERVHKFSDIGLSLSYAHLDIQVLRTHEKYSKGVLPELWGLLPMSEETSKMVRAIDFVECGDKDELGNCRTGAS